MIYKLTAQPSYGRQGAYRRMGTRWYGFHCRYEVDADVQLWVTENDSAPRRISVWDTETGEFLKEFFGPTGYRAPGVIRYCPLAERRCSLKTYF